MDKLANLNDMEVTEHLACRQRHKEVVAQASLSQRSPLMTLFNSLSEWQERMRQRRQLMMLDAHLLVDIGISRADAEAEYRKMPWRL